MLAVGLFGRVVWIIVLRRLIALPVGKMLVKLGRILLVLATAYAAAMLVSRWLPVGDETASQLLRIAIRTVVVVGLAVVLVPILVPGLLNLVKAIFRKRAPRNA